MGLLQTYDSRNKVTQQGLQIKYSCRVQIEQSENATMTYYFYTRYATKRYSYVGMDEQTARDCAAAKLSQYTRDYSLPSKQGNRYIDTPITECMTDVAAVHVDGGMWDVNIAVNETDIKVTTVKYYDPSALFASANGRNYDETGGGGATIELTGVVRGSETEVQFNQTIGNFRPENLIVKVKETEQGGETMYGCKFGSTNNAYVSGSITMYGKLYFTLSYGNIESNTMASDGLPEQEG